MQIGTAALLAYLFLVGVKLVIRKTRDLRQAGASLAILLVPALAVRQWKPAWFDWSFGGSVAVPFDEASTVITIAALLVGVNLVAALVDFLRTRAGREEMLELHRAMLKIGLLVVVGSIAFKVLNPEFEFSKLLASAAVGSLVLGFALQETLGNLFAGLSMETENLFKRGEMIQVGESGLRGTVVEKTWRGTILRTNDGVQVYLPNNEIGKQTVVNYDRPTRVLAMRLKFSAAYDAPPMYVKETIAAVLAAEPEILQKPKFDVWTDGYGDSAINYEVRFWVKDWPTSIETRDRVNTAIWYAFRERGIEIPFPIRTLHAVDPAELKRTADERAERVRGVAERLRSVEPFKSLATDDDCAFLAENARLERHAAGRPVVKKGDHSDAMFVIEKGSCVVQLPNGQSRELSAGAHFGEIGLLHGAQRTTDVLAGGDGAVVVRLGRLAVMKVLVRREALRAALDQTSTARLDELKALAGADGAAVAQPMRPFDLVLRVLRLLLPW